MQVDDTLSGCAVRRCDIFEVRPKLSAVAHRDFDLAGLLQFHFFEPIQIALKFAFEVFVPPFQWIKFYKQRAIRWMQIADAGDGLGFQKAQKFSNTLVRFERDFVSEINEQRLIARWLKSCLGEF